MPFILIVGGPNGAGKSTYSKVYCELKGIPRIDPDYLFQHEFTNPDKSAFPYFLSGLIEEYFENRISFILESNLHNRESYNILDMASRYGYEKRLIYLGTDDLNKLIERVAKRVSEGGHHVDVEE